MLTRLLALLLAISTTTSAALADTISFANVSSVVFTPTNPGVSYMVFSITSNSGTCTNWPELNPSISTPGVAFYTSDGKNAGGAGSQNFNTQQILNAFIVSPLRTGPVTMRSFGCTVTGNVTF